MDAWSACRASILLTEPSNIKHHIIDLDIKHLNMIKKLLIKNMIKRLKQI